MRYYNKNFPYVVASIMIIVGIIVGIILLLYNYRRFKVTDKEEQKIEFLIGVSQANLNEPWRVTMIEEIKEEVEKYPYIRVIDMDAAGSETKQKEDVEKLKDFGIDLLIISPTNSLALTPVISDVYKVMPVIVLDRGIQDYDYTLYIGPDNGQIGKKAGEYIGKTLGTKGGEIVEITGPIESTPVRDRSKGFKEKLLEYPKVTLMGQVNGGWSKDEAEDKMFALYNGYDKVDMVFAHSDAMALGAYKAYRNGGYRYPVQFIGVDGLTGINGGLSLIEKGVLSCTFICPTGGKEAIQYAVDILQNQKGIPKKVILRTKQITKDNIQEYRKEQIKPKKEYDPHKKIVLGFCNVGKEGAWRDANTTSIKNAAKEAGIELIYSEADLDQQKQIDTLEGFIKMGVDVIAFSPVKETGWEEVLRKIKEADIPVIITDRMVKIEEDNLYMTFLGSDFREEGRKAANWVVANSKKEGLVNIVEIQGIEHSTPAVERTLGFAEEMNAFSQFKIIKSVYGDYTYEKGKEIMEGYLKEAYKERENIDVVFAHNDDMALGAIEAIENFGFLPGKEIKIVSIDGIKKAIMALRDGKLNCSVECNPLLGPQLMKIVKDVMNQKELPMQMITDEKVFEQEAFVREWLARTY